MLGIALTSLIVSLLLLVEHWFPWQLMLRRELPRLAAYIAGVLAIVLPLSGLFLFWELHPDSRVSYGGLIALWACVGAGGLSVLLAHAGDELLRKLAHGAEMDELVELKEER